MGELKKSIKIIAFITSYSPLWLILAINNGLKNDSDENLIFKNIKNTKIMYPEIQFSGYAIIFAVVFILSLLLIFIFVYIFEKESKSLKNTNQYYYKIEDYENKDSEVLNYIFTYLIPLITKSGTKGIFIQILLLLVIGSYYITSDLFFINPIFKILGYSSYRLLVSSNDNNLKREEIIYVITKKKSEIIKGKNLKLICISGNFYFLF